MYKSARGLLQYLIVFVGFIPIPIMASPLTIPFWHSLSGHLGQVLKKITQSFNHSQDNYRIKLIYKGNYPETLTNFVAAFKAHEPPPLVQIFEIGTATMLHPKGVIVPVHQVMALSKNRQFNSSQFLPIIQKYYGDERGRLLAMPFNSSSVVLYYNQSLFNQAGIKQIPQTWQDVVKVSKALLAKTNARCGFTSTFPSWVHIETFVNWHGLSFADKNNGVNHLDVSLDYIKPALIHHLSHLRIWQQQHIFEYGGRDSNAVSLFTSGHCAMMLQSSGAYMSLRKMVPFKLGVSQLPYWPRYRQKHYNAVLGGAAIWVVKGFSKDVYQGIAEFLSYLSKPKIQSRWQRLTGYLPVTQKAKDLSAEHSDDMSLLASNIALIQLGEEQQTGAGARLGNYAQIRLYNDEQIEAICSGEISAESAVKEAQTYANFLLRRFESNVRS